MPTKPKFLPNESKMNAALYRLADRSPKIFTNTRGLARKFLSHRQGLPLTSPGEIEAILCELKNRKAPGKDGIFKTAYSIYPYAAYIGYLQHHRRNDAPKLLLRGLEGSRVDMPRKASQLLLQLQTHQSSMRCKQSGWKRTSAPSWERSRCRKPDSGLPARVSEHSYLVGTIKYFVSVGKILSTRRGISAGVPQGSKLSPLLFNLFCVDIPTANPIITALCADNFALIDSIPHICHSSNRSNRFFPKLPVWYHKLRVALTGAVQLNVVEFKSTRNLSDQIHQKQNTCGAVALKPFFNNKISHIQRHYSKHSLLRHLNMGLYWPTSRESSARHLYEIPEIGP